MTHLEEEVRAEDALADPKDAPVSIADRIRKRQQELSELRWIDLDIPGYDGEMFGRYQVLTGQQLGEIRSKIIKSIKGDVDRGVAMACDTLIAACMELYCRDEGREVPIREILGYDTPVRYDEGMAEFLKLKGPEDPGNPGEHLPLTARLIVKGVFGGNDIALGAHQQTYGRWLVENGGSAEDLGEF